MVSKKPLEVQETITTSKNVKKRHASEGVEINKCIYKNFNKPATRNRFAEDALDLDDTCLKKVKNCVLNVNDNYTYYLIAQALRTL